MPFEIGALVTWRDDVPATWRFIWTPGPMIVIDAYWHSGKPSEYAKRFDPNGMCIQPGWIVTIEYDADATDYYDPPLSWLLGKKIRRDVHEKWLVSVAPTKS